LKILTGKPTGKRPLGKSRRRWEEYESIRFVFRIEINGEPL
jgi:hypothetical protein